MSVKNDFIKPVIVLSLICLFISGALAIGNSITQPLIESAAAERAYAARKEIMPDADDFEPMDVYILRNERSLPRGITAIYRATNNVGYIFMITTPGYGGEIKLICGINMDGRIIRTATLSHTETQGLGTPIFEEPHAGQYWGRDRNGIESIAAISGATITSNAYKNGVRDALTAFEIVSGRAR